MTNHERLWVTIDARALDGALMGTQILVLELSARARAHRGAASARADRRGADRRRRRWRCCANCPRPRSSPSRTSTGTPPRARCFHRPQQALSRRTTWRSRWQLGERVVLGQLDLIAYRHGDYFPDAHAWEGYGERAATA